MIAYNHYIKFIPELQNDKKVEREFSDVITIQENSIFEAEDKLPYEMNFPESQGRNLALFSNREFNNIDKDKLWGLIKGISTTEVKTVGSQLNALQEPSASVSAKS